MGSWIAPNDSPIWNSLNESHPNLELPIKQRVFVLLQDSNIPPTDKIFPWIVETMINRVTMEGLADKLESTQEGMAVLPGEVSKAVGRSLSDPIGAVQANHAAVEGLTQELRRNSVIEASLKSTGWRGVICALEAMGQHRSLGLTVGAIALLSALVSGVIVWGLGEGDRKIIQFNQQTFENCYAKFATDQDGNGWFSCPGVQLPMRK